MRGILAAPADGFRTALRTSWGGASTYLLTMAGGASLALLWLKIGAIAGLREICAPQYLAGYVVAAAVLGALLALIVMPLWAAAAARAAPFLGGERPEGGTLRFVWGASVFPHVLALLVLLPLDLLIVGGDTFTTRSLDEPLASFWAALSIALAVSITLWGVWLLVRGFQAATDLPTTRALAGPALAVMVGGVVVGAFVLGARSLPEGSPCPTQPR